MTDKKMAAGGNQTANENKQGKHNKSGGGGASRYWLKAILPDGREKRFIGQMARSLSHLVKAGARGITALEVSCWAYRLASYVFDLRHKVGLCISTVEEPHENGWHARYVLQSPVLILEEG